MLILLFYVRYRRPWVGGGVRTEFLHFNLPPPLHRYRLLLLKYNIRHSLVPKYENSITRTIFNINILHERYISLILFLAHKKYAQLSLSVHSFRLPPILNGFSFPVRFSTIDCAVTPSPVFLRPSPRCSPEECMTSHRQTNTRPSFS